MSNMTLTKVQMRSGIWEGQITGATEDPDIRVMHQDQPVDGVELVEGDDPGTWELAIPIPQDAVSDGIQTVLIFNGENDRIGSFSLIAGDALDDDIRSEVDLLRAELDMLKRAFRRHCVETM